MQFIFKRFLFRRISCRAAALLFLCACLATFATAQDLMTSDPIATPTSAPFSTPTSTAPSTSGSGELSCFNSTLTSVPSRPTVTSATDTTQCGVVEVEYGLERQWPGGGANRDDLTGGLRFGLTPNLDFHWSSSEFIHLRNEDGNRTGYGDNWLGLRYRFLGQTKLRPSLGVFYEAKVPTADPALGLGSGKVDHSISFLASKDVRKLHFDFNAIELLAGRPDATGFDHDTGFALATWLPLTKRLSGVLEPYGYTSLNQFTPAFASTTLGFNYKAQARMYLDGGLDMGVSHDAPHKRVFVGVTYAMSNLYSLMRSR
jgi:hypothetical protein